MSGGQARVPGRRSAVVFTGFAAWGRSWAEGEGLLHPPIHSAISIPPSGPPPLRHALRWPLNSRCVGLRRHLRNRPWSQRDRGHPLIPPCPRAATLAGRTKQVPRRGIGPGLQEPAQASRPGKQRPAAKQTSKLHPTNSQTYLFCWDWPSWKTCTFSTSPRLTPHSLIFPFYPSIGSRCLVFSAPDTRYIFCIPSPNSPRQRQTPRFGGGQRRTTPPNTTPRSRFGPYLRDSTRRAAASTFLPRSTTAPLRLDRPILYRTRE